MEWVEAAAQVAHRENYEDLKFQIAHGSAPRRVWVAIHDLPGMEPLDAFIEQVWRAATTERGSWRWRQLAVVAAHYGHKDALEALVGSIEMDWVWWEAFQRLTGYDGALGNRLPSEFQGEAKRWFEEKKDHLVFNRSTMSYEVR